MKKTIRMEINYLIYKPRACLPVVIDDAFFNRIGLERIRVVRPEIGLLLGWFADSRCSTPLQRQERRKGQRGLRPWSIRCLSQFLAERKDKLLRGRMCLRMFAYLSPIGWPDIYSVYYSQLKGSKDYFPFDGIFLTFIGF